MSNVREIKRTRAAQARAPNQGKAMNALYLYPSVAGAFLAVLTFHFTPSSLKRSQDRATAVGETTWVAAEDDAARYRTHSMQEIEAYTLTLQAMASRCERGEYASRDYLHTRLQALREHIDYARGEALKLPSSRGDENFMPAYGHFHRTLVNLKGAFAQAADELNDGA
jgi:hypothetical protein